MRIILALLSLTIVQAYKDNHDGQNCVDISRYGDLTFNQTTVELCNYKFKTQCQKRSEYICKDVPVHHCVVEGYPECEDHESTVPARDDSFELNDFHAMECKSGVKKPLTEIKMMPVCETVTKQQCDTKWVLNAAGEKIWAGNENCKDVTWDDCSLQPREVTTEVDTYECTEDPVAIAYQTVNRLDVDVPLFSRTCKAVAKSVCSVTTDRQCETVEWEDCQDTVVPNCFKTMFRVPHQEFNHLLRCTVGH